MLPLVTGAAACVAALAALAIVAFAAKLAHTLWRFNKLPLPSPPVLSPILGHACSLMSEAAPVKLADYGNALGPCFKLRLFDTAMVMLLDPHEIARVNRIKGSFKPNIYRFFDLPSTRGRETMFSAPGGPYWKAVRTAVAPCFSATSLKRTFPWLLGLTKSAADGIAASGGGGGLDVSDLACRLTSDTIGDMLVGEDFGAVKRWRAQLRAAAAAGGDSDGGDNNDDTGKSAGGGGGKDCATSAPDYVPLVRGYLAAVHERINHPLVAAGLMRPSRANRAAMTAWDAAVGGVAARARAAPPPDYTIAARLLAMTDPDTGRPLDEERLAGELSIMYIAGFETTSHAIAWTLGLLACNPETQDRLAAELAAAGLSSNGSTNGGDSASLPREFAWSDLNRLPYLQAVLRESMRLYAPASGGSLRALPVDAVVCGVTLPKGTLIAQPLYGLGHSRANYGEDADAFRPERWLAAAAAAAGGGEPADTAAAADTAKKGGSSINGGDSDSGAAATKAAASSPPPDPLSFSVGPRDCVGQALAQLELQVVIATLVGRFSWALPPGAPRGPPADAFLREKLCYHVTLFPRGGLDLVATPRGGKVGGVM